MADRDESELQQADLSHLRLQDMTPDQRAELRRRYTSFVRHFGGTGAAPTRYEAPRPHVRKWVPGRKA